ncbi:MAG: hypothetical protein ACRC35_04580 [Angustibacter sp.]
MAHSDVNDEEAHDAVSLDMLADVELVGAEELRECEKAVVDPESGRRLTCALATSWA